MTAFSRSTKSDIRSIEPVAAAAAPSEPHRRNALLSLWNHRWMILLITLLFLGIAIARVLRATPIYEATAKITVEQSRPAIVSNDPNADTAQTQNFLYTQAAVIRSRTVLEAVAQKDGIANLPTFQSPETSNVVAYLQQHVLVDVGRRDDVIGVSVLGPKTYDDAVLANAVVEKYADYISRQRRSSTKEVLDILLRQRAKLDDQIDKLGQQKLDFQRKYASLIIGNDRVNPTLDRLVQLRTELTNAELDRLNADLEFQTTKAMATDPAKAAQLLHSHALRGDTSEVRGEIRKFEEQLQSASGSYLPGMAQLTEMQAALKKLQEEQAADDKEVLDAYLAELETRAAFTKQKEVELQSLYDDQNKQVIELNSKRAEFDQIDSSLKDLESFYGDISKRLQDLGVVEDANITTINPLDDAKDFEAVKVEPNAPTTTFEALILGLAVGCALAFGRDWIDQRMRSAEEIKQVVQLPILGVVPHIINARTPSQRGMQLHLDPMSDVAEAYRAIRTGVYFGTPGGTAKTLLITSPSPGDGKSTLASNLSVAMAQAGNRILLLDADFRKPMQHKIFNITSGTGLSSVLAGNISLEEAIHETVVSNLSILPCGPIPANPSEILNSQTFADLLDQLVDQYDHVVLDSPPVMPVTDSRILAASCDVTILALRAEKSTRKGAIYARDTLRSVGARLLGVVVNDVPRRKGIYGYYYSDSYLYQYGYGNSKARGSSSSNGSANGSAGGSAGGTAGGLAAGSASNGSTPPKQLPAVANGRSE